jgi:hypothetical protein
VQIVIYLLTLLNFTCYFITAVWRRWYNKSKQHRMLLVVKEVICSKLMVENVLRINIKSSSARWLWPEYDTCCGSLNSTLLLYLVYFLMKLDLRWDIQQPITIAVWGQPSVAAWQRYQTFVSEQFSVVTFYRLANASLAWTISLGCKIYSATLVSSALYRVTRPRSTRIQSSHPTLPTLLRSALLIGFRPSFTRKRICYNVQRAFRRIHSRDMPTGKINWDWYQQEVWRNV